MLNRSALCAAIMAVGAVATPVAVDAAEFRTASQPVAGQYIVVLKQRSARLDGEAGNRAAPVAAVAGEIARLNRAKLLFSYRKVLRGFAVRASEEALLRMLDDPRIDYIQEDSRVSIDESPIAQLPTQYGPTWGLDRIDQRDLPLNAAYSYMSGAGSVHAYILDTGIVSTHSEFGARVGAGFSAVADGQGTNDCHGHGTHVAGTVGGKTYGVAKALTLHPVRVLGCDGTGYKSAVIAGMDWIRLNHVKPAVVNMSFGGAPDVDEDAAVENLTTAGVVVVAAAGNDSGDACAKSPSRVPSAITVGSTRPDDGRSWFTNTGSCVDLFAPGSGITSASKAGPTAAELMSGTSMAAPHVSGVAALILAGLPTATPAQVASVLNQRTSNGRVLGLPAGTANRLLYSLSGTGPSPPGDGNLPTITSFQCPVAAESGGGTFVCRVTYASSSPAAVLWSKSDLRGDYYDTCLPGFPVTVPVAVANRYGSVGSSRTFTCKGGPVP